MANVKPFIFALLVLFMCGNPGAQASEWQPPPGRTHISIWPKEAPDAQPAADQEIASPGKSLVAGRTVVVVERVSQPTLTVFPPVGTNTGVAVVVFPGGGYKVLAIDLEGTEICEWLASRGITGILLKYRVPFSGPYWDDRHQRHANPKKPLALEDAQRSLGLIRLHAAEWHIDPHKIGVLGFSAGGHLVADIGTHFGKRLYPAIDAADRESCRPDFGVALYPGHMLENTTREFELNPRIPVSSDTPPTFVLQAADDPVDDVKNSLVYFAALKKAGVPVEMHIYAHGGHAFGLRPSKFPITEWPRLLEKWLATIGMLPEPVDSLSE